MSPFNGQDFTQNSKKAQGGRRKSTGKQRSSQWKNYKTWEPIFNVTIEDLLDYWLSFSMRAYKTYDPKTADDFWKR